MTMSLPSLIASHAHPLPEVNVIEILADIIDDRLIFRCEGFLTNVLNALAGIFGAVAS